MPSSPSHDALEPGTAGADINPPPAVPETQTVAAELTEEAGFYRRMARHLNDETNALHQRSQFIEWNARTNARARLAVQEMLAEMAAFGFAWRDIARMVGVSIPAIQKWRRGEGTSGESRQKVASLLAACDLVSEDYGIREVASWFETPLQIGVPVTPIDLWVDGRPDLVFEFASGHADSEQVLTGWDPHWRERYRSEFEVFRAGDGELSIRPRSGWRDARP